MSKKQAKKLTITNQRLVLELHPAVVSLGSKSMKNLKGLMAVAKMKKTIEESLESYNGLRQKIAEQDCERDDNGKPIVENNSYTYKDDATKQRVNILIGELLNEEIELELPKLKEEWLDEVEGLTGNVISALLDLIE
jgi:hypothetical protein